MQCEYFSDEKTKIRSKYAWARGYGSPKIQMVQGTTPAFPELGKLLPETGESYC